MGVASWIAPKQSPLDNLPSLETNRKQKGPVLETDSTMSHSWKGQTVEISLKTAKATGNDNNPGFVWLGGFKSDMDGTKAQAMVEHANQLSCSSLRFDYSGHGSSGGKFTDGTISRWVDESLEVIQAQTQGPQILVGSSMGGWIALRVAQELEKLGKSNLLAGLLLIAPAPDFTSLLMEPSFSDVQRVQMDQRGFIEEPSDYSDEPNIITKDLIEDGRLNAVLSGDLALNIPVRILQGMQDPDVPYTHALKLVETLAHDDVAITIIKEGDHRLSREQDIVLLKKTMADMILL